MRMSTPCAAVLVLCSVVVVFGQEETTFDGRPVRVYSNDKLTLALRSVGGAMVQLLMKDDPEQLNPLQGLGHFVCVDGFGPVSQEERAAGLPGRNGAADPAAGLRRCGSSPRSRCRRSTGLRWSR